MAEFSNIVFENGVMRPWWPSWQRDLRLHILYSVQSMTWKFLKMTAEITSRTGSHLFEYGLTDFAWSFTLCILTSLSVEFEWAILEFLTLTLSKRGYWSARHFVKIAFICIRIKNHLRSNGLALSLALKRKLWVTQKWFIVRDVNFIWFSFQTGKLERICTRFQRAGWKCRIWRKRKWIWYRKYSTVYCAQ